jgi:hypothetical protein
MSSNVSKFISKLDKLGEGGIEVFVPSKKKSVTVTPLNLKQQKDLISSVLDGVRGTLDFSRALNNIILDNSGISDLKIFDKIPFAVNMRIQALGTKYIDDEYSKVDLQSVLDNIKNTKLQLKEEKLIEYKNLQIKLTIPTLQYENALLKKGASDLDERPGLKEEVSALYMLEIVKYIKEIKIDDITIEMADTKIADRINLVEKLPLAVYADISDYIETVTSYNTGLLTVGDNKISIDSLFFDSTST